ncbi:DNA polymerase III subunit chi [Chromobacterium haemolyticum]|uniref:DNA polymerase III subunit chi n=1 Tax=Chromobacterium TaxID=535 RepID=UPI0040579CF4
MSRIDFYTKVADPQGFACLLAATVMRKGGRLLVWFDSEQQLDTFSRQLWSFGDTRFVPHCRLGADEAADTPIWLTARLPDALEHPVLLNLGSNLPERMERFDRILEIVGRDEASLETARLRFKAYRERGYAIEHHDMSNK